MDQYTYIEYYTYTTIIVRRNNDVTGNGKVTDNNIRRINPNDDIRNADGYGEHR